MRYEIRPEPTEDERAAIVAALTGVDRPARELYGSGWRLAALTSDDYDYAAEVPPRSNRGATRA